VLVRDPAGGRNPDYISRRTAANRR
jgi:hypothetical protein